MGTAGLRALEASFYPCSLQLYLVFFTLAASFYR